MIRYQTKLIEDVFNLFDTFPSLDFPKPKLPDALCSGSFPPSNIMVDEDGNFVIQIACAGYTQEGIKLEYEEHYIYVELTDKGKSERATYYQRGIKKLDTLVKYYLSPKYDETKIKATFTNGILAIKVPLKEGMEAIKIKVE